MGEAIRKGTDPLVVSQPTRHTKVSPSPTVKDKAQNQRRGQ